MQGLSNSHRIWSCMITVRYIATSMQTRYTVAISQPIRAWVPICVWIASTRMGTHTCLGHPIRVWAKIRIWYGTAWFLNSWFDSSSIPIVNKDLRYHMMRFYGRALKFTRIIRVKILIPDFRITLIPLVIPLDSYRAIACISVIRNRVGPLVRYRD